jgi:hypothetical protein
MSTQEFRITNGPSKFDLMVALFHGSCDNRHLVNFSVVGEIYPIIVLINSVSREDVSGDCWIIKGSVFYQNKAYAGKIVKIFFSTRTGNGNIKISF